MPQVTVKDFAHVDARLPLAARLLKINHERLGWRLIGVWSQATARNSPIMAPDLVGMAIGRKGEDVARAFIQAELAEWAGHDLDLSPMQTMFGDCNWLKKVNGTASAGGQVRAATGERAPDGTFISASARESLHDRVVAQLDAGTHDRKTLRLALGCRKSDVLAAVRDLVADGIVLDEDGLLRLAHAVPAPVPTITQGTGREPGTSTTAEPGTGFREPTGNRPEPVPGTMREPGSGNREPEPSSALAPALAPAPAHTSAREGTGNQESAEPTGDANPLAIDEVVAPERRRPIARLLWAYQNQCRAELDANAPAPALDETPGGSLDAVIRQLGTHSPRQCRHALDMFKLEGKYLCKAGENPFRYLNGFTNWKPEPFGRRAGTTADAIAKDARARKAARARNDRSSADQGDTPPRRKRLN